MRIPDMLRFCLLLAGFVMAACQQPDASPAQASASPARVQPLSHEQVAVFAGGCFWCIEAELEAVAGVRSVVSGYTGGSTPSPSYGNMGDHAEAVEVIFDPGVVSYSQLLEVFWSNIDPFDAGGQFYDRGSQYRTAIFVADSVQEEAARMSLEANARRLGQPVVTAVLPVSDFYPAEAYHQDYYLKQPDHYMAYKKASGREETLQQIWRPQ